MEVTPITAMIYKKISPTTRQYLICQIRHVTEYFPAKTGEYPRLVYTKTVDSVDGAR